MIIKRLYKKIKYILIFLELFGLLISRKMIGDFQIGRIDFIPLAVKIKNYIKFSLRPSL